MKWQAHKRARAMRAILRSRFPACFGGRGGPKRPLKLGILADICARCGDLDRHDIALALADYCASLQYLTALARGGIRVDLAGNPCGDVSVVAAKDATWRLAKLAANNARQAVAGAAAGTGGGLRPLA